MSEIDISEEVISIFTDPIIILKSDGKIRGFNSAAAEMLGAAPTGERLATFLCGGEEAYQKATQMSRRLSAPLPIKLSLLSHDKKSFSARGSCRRLGRGPSLAGFIVRLQKEDGDRFALLNRKLDELNREIRERRKAQKLAEQALEENRLLLLELRHRVKNNLQMLTALFRRQAAKADTEEARHALVRASERLAAMSAAQTLMYNEPSSSIVDARALMENLSDSIANTASTEVTIDFNFEEQWVVPHQIVTPLALIFNEILTNSLKYGLNDNSARISISLSKSDTHYQLQMRDYGKGFPAENDRKGGIGLTLIDGLAGQIGARVDRSNDHGAATTILIPRTEQ